MGSCQAQMPVGGPWWGLRGGEEVCKEEEGPQAWGVWYAGLSCHHPSPQ